MPAATLPVTGGGALRLPPGSMLLLERWLVEDAAVVSAGEEIAIGELRFGEGSPHLVLITAPTHGILNQGAARARSTRPDTPWPGSSQCDTLDHCRIGSGQSLPPERSPWLSPLSGPGTAHAAKRRTRTAATTASLPKSVHDNEEVVPVNVSRWVLPSGVTAGR